MSPTQIGLALAGWGVLAGLVFPPRPWQTHHPRRTLLAWAALTVLFYGLSGLVLAQLIVAAVDPQSKPRTGAVLIVAGAWCALLVIGAALSWVLTRAEDFVAIDDDAVETIEALRHAAAYQSEVRGSWRITYLLSDHPMAWTHPSRREVLVTSSLVEHLSPAEVSAVITHEEHHVQAHHPLLLRVSRLHAACIPTRALRAVDRRTRLLVELAADDHAADRCGPQATIGALTTIATLTGNHAAALRAYRLQVRWGGDPASGHVT